MEVIRRAIKYLIEGGAIAVAAYVIPQKKLQIQEILLISLTGAAILAILDTFSPTTGAATRTGSGLGIGLGLVGM